MSEMKILNKVRTLLGMEIKLESMLLSDGLTSIEADSFESGVEVFIATADGQMIALPVGEYELEDLRILVVVEEGVIGEIRDAVEEVVEEEIPVDEAPVEEELKQEASAPKKEIVTSSTTKETHFSEEVELLKKEIEELKVQLANQDEVAELVAPIELAEEPKAISYNPENESVQNIMRYATKSGRTTMDSILEKMNKI